jgi:hypothetical protein
MSFFIQSTQFDAIEEYLLEIHWRDQQRGTIEIFEKQPEEEIKTASCIVRSRPDKR